MKKTTIFVRVKFGYGSHRFKITKNKKWGAVDHVILQYIARKPSTSRVLAEVSGLPRQLITEIVIPLMQVGWVEITHNESGYFFQATQRGLAVATNEELPSDNEPMIRTRNFLIDPITQECYRLEKKQKKQHFKVYNYMHVQDILEEYRGFVAEVKVNSPYSPDLTDIFNCVANFDEEVSGFDEDVVKRNYADSVKYAIATVDDDNDIQGVPDISDELKDAILFAANLQRQKIQLLGSEKFKDETSLSSFETVPVTRALPFHYVDMSEIEYILGGEQHRKHLYDSIKNSLTRIIIHSTFINDSYLDELFPELLIAAKRSVQIDILWGQTEPEEPKKFLAYQKVIDKLDSLQKRINSEGLSTQFRLHLTPTQSHAKFIVSDNEDIGWFATFGSCNWLASGFYSFESSICIKSLPVVSDALSIASRLAMGGQGLSNALSRELAVLSTLLKRRSLLSVTLDSGCSVKVQFLASDQHHKIVNDASDKAKSEIFVCSHRISFAGERPIITPLKSAIRDNSSLLVKIIYGTTSGTMRRMDLSELKENLIKAGVHIVKAEDPRIHAKILTWDNDNVVVTSLNWLSASAVGDIYSEVGVHLEGEGVASPIKMEFKKLYGEI